MFTALFCSKPSSTAALFLRAMRAKKTRLTTQCDSADAVRNLANVAYQNKLDELNSLDEQKMDMEEKMKMMQENHRKLDKKREEIARQKETAATDAEEAAREAHSGKEKLDAFIVYVWTLMVKAGFATTTEGNPDLPFTGASGQKKRSWAAGMN